MADQYDGREAQAEMQRGLDRAIAIRNDLNSVINAFYDTVPRSEDEARTNKGKVRDALIAAEDGYRKLVDSAF